VGKTYSTGLTISRPSQVSETGSCQNIALERLPWDNENMADYSSLKLHPLAENFSLKKDTTLNIKTT